jgi:hypothetical protein
MHARSTSRKVVVNRGGSWNFRMIRMALVGESGLHKAIHNVSPTKFRPRQLLIEALVPLRGIVAVFCPGGVPAHCV